MFKNNFKIAWRTMTRQKMYTGIKIGGFALGLATCILIFLYIRNEISYDKYYKKAARTYRIYNRFHKTTDDKWTAFPPMVAHILKNDYPEVEKSGRLIPYNWFNAGNNLLHKEDDLENSYEEKFAYADQELIDILEIPIIYGSPGHVLDEPHTILISKNKADKFYPGQNPVGKMIILNDDKSKPFVIGGVMENFPVNSHLQYDYLITLAGVEFWPGEQTSWCCWNYDTYVQIRPDANLAALEKKMLSMRDTYLIDYLRNQGDKSLADVQKYQTFVLEPVTDIYLRSDVQDNLSHGDSRYVWLFGAIACFILLLAGINFINLSTAKSANRAKEVGLRKVVGSARGYLIRQFLTESLVYSFISFFLSIAIVFIALPSFNALAGKSLTIPWLEWWFMPALVLAAIVVGLLAGIYPSFYLSAFNPIDVLKGPVSKGAKSSTLRSAMVIFQFTTSIALIIGTFIIYRQMNYINNAKVGFDKDHVIVIQGVNTLNEKFLTFKDALLEVNGVQYVSSSSYLPVSGTNRDQSGFWKEGKSKEDVAVGAQHWHVDPDYVKTMGMKIVDGRDFNKLLASDSQATIINQAMAKALGLNKPVGERITNGYIFNIIGVVEDFNFESMKGKIMPLALMTAKGGANMIVKIKTRDMRTTLASVEKVWHTMMPHQPIRYTFLEDSFARMYEDVQRTGSVFASFAVLAILVACLGLFALSAFMVEQRSKEISIRLVLGASVNNILLLLTGNFVKLVLISFVIAAPLAWYMMNKWLEDYTYRISITWDVFIISGITSIVIALMTISFQSIRAAFANPASSLRSE